MSLVEHISKALARADLSSHHPADLIAVEVERRWPKWTGIATAIVAELRRFDVAAELIFPVFDRIFGSKAGSETRAFNGDRSMWNTLWQRMLDEAAGNDTNVDDDPAVNEPVQYCQPRYEGKIQPPKFIIRFEDSEMDDIHFDDEAEARTRFANLSVSWNCYLFGTLPLHPHAEAARIERDYRTRLEAFNAWLVSADDPKVDDVHAKYLEMVMIDQ